VENDIIVSLITIKGEECKTELLGKIVNRTNGNLTRVNPEDIAKDFSGILKVNLKNLIFKILKKNKIIVFFLIEK
jgi:hypothetical protein